MSCLSLLKSKRAPPEIQQQYRDNLLWIQQADHNRLVVGSQARILYSDEEGRRRIANAFNEAIAEGRILRTLVRTPPAPGKNLYLTLDAELQNAAEQAFDDRAGAAVAIDPNNGEVLALVSKPTFDPNLFVNGIDSETYQSLRNDDTQPLFNRALRGQYPPGSTVKPFVGLAGLEYEATTSDRENWCPGCIGCRVGHTGTGTGSEVVMASSISTAP